ncbi:MAG: TonB-dependent receptor plug domain-containing protein [Gammaproteobacteria bacterium]
MFNKENYLFAVLALSFGLFNADLVAQEEAADNVEEVVITGSRIKRKSLNSAAQVSTITSEDIDASSALMTADVLRNSIYNSFGSSGPTAGSSAMGNATVSVRGLGSSRTLILMDGRRMPGSPHLGGSGAVNINMIPTVAVDRIEILADGASSVYGSDAIAGVINVITKKGFDGMEFNFRRGDRDRDDGEENSVSFIYGATNDKGYVTIMVEHDERDEIYLKDRWYTKASINDKNGDGVVDLYNETYGLSWYSRNLADPVTGDIMATPTCPGSQDNPTDGWWGPNFGGAAFGQGATSTPSNGGPARGICGFAWADIMVQDAATFRDSITTNIDYEINDKISLYSRINYLRNESTGRYAPPAARYPSIAVGDAANPYDVPVTGYWRWTEIGNRGMHQVDQGTDAVFELTYKVNDDVEVVYGTQINKFYGVDIGRYYLSYAGLDSNNLNNEPFGSAAGAAAMSSTTLVEYTNHYEKNDVVVQIDNIMDLPGGSVSALFGIENFENRYSAEYDKHSENGLVGGSAGNSGAGIREVDSVFGEVLFPVMDNLEITASFRSDDYSDVGESDSFKLGALWTPMAGTIVKLNTGEGFRAPTMDNLYGATTFSANTVYDYKACAAAGTSAADCASKQVSTLIKANPNLGAESSEGFTMSVEQDMGMLVDALEGLQVRFDYYEITITDAIASISTQDVMWNDFVGGSALSNNVTFFNAAGIAGDGTAAGAPTGTGVVGDACPAGSTYVRREGNDSSIYVIRSCANGRVDYVGAGFTNVGEIEVVGYDLFVNYTRDVGPGVMNVSLDYTEMDEYNTDSFTGSSQKTNNVGFEGTPSTRNNLSLSYAWDIYSVALTQRNIGDYRLSQDAEKDSAGNPTGGIVKAGGTQDEYSAMDLQIKADLGKYGVVTYGMLNVEDEDPLPNANGDRDAYLGLYSNQGLISYLKWNVKF